MVRIDERQCNSGSLVRSLNCLLMFIDKLHRFFSREMLWVIAELLQSEPNAVVEIPDLVPQHCGYDICIVMQGSAVDAGMRVIDQPLESAAKSSR